MATLRRERDITRRLNYLNRVEKVRRLYNSLQDGGRTDIWIWENHVGPTFCISLGTMRRMLTIRISHERKIIEEMIKKMDDGQNQPSPPDQLELF